MQYVRCNECNAAHKKSTYLGTFPPTEHERESDVTVDAETKFSWWPRDEVANPVPRYHDIESRLVLFLVQCSYYSLEGVKTS